MLKNTKKYIGNVASIRVENILHFQIKGCWEAYGRKDIGDVGKAPKELLLRQQGAPKKNIMCAKNINVLVGEN
jgi:hypothetical protein